MVSDIDIVTEIQTRITKLQAIQSQQDKMVGTVETLKKQLAVQGYETLEAADKDIKAMTEAKSGLVDELNTIRDQMDEIISTAEKAQKE